MRGKCGVEDAGGAVAEDSGGTGAKGTVRVGSEGVEGAGGAAIDDSGGAGANGTVCVGSEGVEGVGGAGGGARQQRLLAVGGRMNILVAVVSGGWSGTNVSYK